MRYPLKNKTSLGFVLVIVMIFLFMMNMLVLTMVKTTLILEEMAGHYTGLYGLEGLTHKRLMRKLARKFGVNCR